MIDNLITNAIAKNNPEVQRMIDTSIKEAITNFKNASEGSPAVGAAPAVDKPPVKVPTTHPIYAAGYTRAVADMLKGGEPCGDRDMLLAGTVRAFVKGLRP